MANLPAIFRESSQVSASASSLARSLCRAALVRGYADKARLHYSAGTRGWRGRERERGAERVYATELPRQSGTVTRKSARESHLLVLLFRIRTLPSTSTLGAAFIPDFFTRLGGMEETRIRKNRRCRQVVAKFGRRFVCG